MDLKEQNDRLLSILKCPTCSDYIVPPIPMCSKGHTFCKTCSYEFPSCSTCQEDFTGRNYAMEEVAELVIYPCKYASAGCDAELHVKDKEEHDQDCLLRRLPCQFRGCEWESNISDYLQHLSNTHLDHLVVGTDKVVNVDRSKSIVVTEWVFYAFDRFFLLTFITSTQTETMLQWKVICQGSMKEASKFYFTFSISDPKNRHNSIQFSCTPGSTEYIQSTPDIGCTKVFERQFLIPIDLIYPYKTGVEDHTVPMKINVHKIPEGIEFGQV